MWFIPEQEKPNCKDSTGDCNRAMLRACRPSRMHILATRTFVEATTAFRAHLLVLLINQAVTWSPSRYWFSISILTYVCTWHLVVHMYTYICMYAYEYHNTASNAIVDSPPLPIAITTITACGWRFSGWVVGWEVHAYMHSAQTNNIDYNCSGHN